MFGDNFGKSLAPKVTELLIVFMSISVFQMSSHLPGVLCDSSFNCSSSTVYDPTSQTKNADGQNYDQNYIFYLNSQNFPSHYFPMTNCMYTINVPENFKVVIEFLHFDVEEPTKLGVCEFDKLSLILSSDQVFEFCGNQSSSLENFVFILTDSEIALKFQSDASEQFSGFNIRVSYYPIHKNVKFVFDRKTEANGTLQSPNALAGQPFLPENIEWTADLTVPESKCIYMHFSPLATILNSNISLNSSYNMSTGEACSVRYSYTTEVGSKISNEVCFESLDMITIDIPHQSVHLYFSTLVSANESWESNQINLPSFLAHYTIHQNAACLSEQSEKFSLNIVGLWFIVSISSIVVIIVFSIQGFVKHCVESRQCCYKYRNRLTASRRNSASVAGTPKFTRQKRSVNHRGIICMPIIMIFLVF